MVFLGHAHAAYNLYAYPDGPNVVAGGSGSHALGGLTPSALAQVSARTLPGLAHMVVGAPSVGAALTRRSRR